MSRPRMVLLACSSRSWGRFLPVPPLRRRRIGRRHVVIIVLDQARPGHDHPLRDDERRAPAARGQELPQRHRRRHGRRDRDQPQRAHERAVPEAHGLVERGLSRRGQRPRRAGRVLRDLEHELRTSSRRSSRTATIRRFRTTWTRSSARARGSPRSPRSGPRACTSGHGPAARRRDDPRTSSCRSAGAARAQLRRTVGLARARVRERHDAGVLRGPAAPCNRWRTWQAAAHTAPARSRRRTSIRSTATASCPASRPGTLAVTPGPPTPRSASSRTTRRGTG